MERLTAFEFIGASDAPQVVRLRHANGTVLAHFGFVQWIGVDLQTLVPDGFVFERREDLVLEGEGLGHPYWNDERPSWVTAFDGRSQAQHIEAIRAAVRREINRARIAQC